MKAKQVSFTAVVMCLALFMSGCAWTVVEPGHVGIIVNMTGTDRGVSSYATTTGRTFYNPINTSVFQYPTYVQNAVWTHAVTEGNPVDESITFTTKDSMAVNADFNVSYELEADKVPQFYTKFRNDDIQAFTTGFFHSIARDCINRMGGLYNVEQIMGDNAPFLDAARKCLQDETNHLGVKIDSFGFIGAPRPPDSVIQAINTKVQASQIALQKQNEVLQAQADAQKQIAQAEGNAKAHIAQAEGEAEANRKLASSLSQQLMEWRKLDIQQQAVSKWNGQRPQVEGGNSGLLMNVTPHQN